MSLPIITGLYAGLLGVLLFILTVRVGIIRGKTGISLYHGDNESLAVRIRQHGNFTEYVPLALLLVAFAEMSGASTTMIHALGGTLLAARILHPFGISYNKASTPARALGTLATSGVILVSAGWAIYQFYLSCGCNAS